MDDYMVQNTETEKVDTSVNSESEERPEPKQYNLKSAKTALARMQAESEKKTEQIAMLKKEIAELKPQIRKMSILVEQLETAETQKKVYDTMKSKHLNHTQLMVALNLVQRLDGDLEHMDIDELEILIRSSVSDKTKEAETEKVDTSSNFSFQGGSQSNITKPEE